MIPLQQHIKAGAGGGVVYVLNYTANTNGIDIAAAITSAFGWSAGQHVDLVQLNIDDALRSGVRATPCSDQGRDTYRRPARRDYRRRKSLCKWQGRGG